MKRHFRKKDYILYLYNKKKLFENGIKLNNYLMVKTWDYEDIEEITNMPIIEFIDKINQEDEFKTKNKIDVFQDVDSNDILYGDWWRIGNPYKDIMKYVTISTPYLRNTKNEKYLDIEISHLIDTHYHKIFGYGKKYYIESKFVKTSKSKFNKYYELKVPNKYKNIKDTRLLIKEWITNNKDSVEYKYYKELINKDNEINYSLKEPTLVESEDKYSVNLIIPYFYKDTFQNIFINILNNKVNKINKNIYTEESIENKLEKNEKTKEFLSQFIPNIPKNLFRKRNKFRKK